MTGKNNLHTKILKQDFGANNGKQFQLLRQKLEIIEFNEYCKDNDITPNQTQLDHIEKVNSEYEFYNHKINVRLGTVTLKNMEETVEEESIEE